MPYGVNIGDASAIANSLPSASRTANANGAAVDLQTYEGEAVAVLDSSAATAGSSPTLDVKLQDSDDGSTGWNDISGATFTQVTNAASAQRLSFNTDECKRYVRAVGTLGGTSTPTFVYSVNVVAWKKIAA